MCQWKVLIYEKNHREQKECTRDSLTDLNSAHGVQSTLDILNREARGDVLSPQNMTQHENCSLVSGSIEHVSTVRLANVIFSKKNFPGITN